MPDDLFAVVQSKFERIEPETLENALTAGGKVPKADASRAARRNRGFLAQRQSRLAAEGIANQLLQAGHAVRVLPMSGLAELGRPVSITWLNIQDAALGIPLSSQELLLDVPWSSVFVINAGHLSVLEQQAREVASVDGRGRPTLETRTSHRSERYPAVEIVGVSLAGSLIYARLVSLRMQGAKMPGVPLQLPRHMQFFFVLEWLVQRATAAFISPETRKMLADRQADRTRTEGALQFEADERAFTDYTRWLLQLVMFREAERGA